MLTHKWIDSCKGTASYEALKEEVRKGVQFDCGDASNVKTVGYDSLREARPPYPVTILQFETRGSDIHSHIIALYSEGSSIESLMILGVRSRDDGKWFTKGPRLITKTDLGFEFKAPSYENISYGDYLEGLMSTVHTTVLSFFSVLGCSNVKTVNHPAPVTLNKKRIRNGKLPIFEHKTLVIDLNKELTVAQDLGGTHASPRVHLRRGHIRNLSSGKKIWIQPCVVGSSHGLITKDYKVVSEKCNISVPQPVYSNH